MESKESLGKRWLRMNYTEPTERFVRDKVVPFIEEQIKTRPGICSVEVGNNIPDGGKEGRSLATALYVKDADVVKKALLAYDIKATVLYNAITDDFRVIFEPVKE
jgi:hypothetical protein